MTKDAGQDKFHALLVMPPQSHRGPAAKIILVKTSFNQIYLVKFTDQFP